jgi:hypothetical protein
MYNLSYMYCDFTQLYFHIINKLYPQDNYVTEKLKK